MENNRIIRSYGRKRSRGLSESQKTSLSDLYELYGIQLHEQPVVPQDFFDGKFKDVFIEIGFGGGEHLINNAIQKYDYGFIGCEPFENGVANALKKIHENNLKNVRIYNGDARVLLGLFPENSINRFYVLFPDPWTKQKHHKRRLLSEEFIGIMQEKLVNRGDIIIATDSESYMVNILDNIQKNPKLELFSTDFEYLSKKPSCLLSTRYEQKAISKGKKAYYLRVKK